MILKEHMKVLLIILVSLFLSACGDKNDATTVEKIVGTNIEGTYVASDKTAVTFKDGVITMEAHGVFPARSTTYKLVNKRIEFTFDAPVYFQIKDDGALVYLGILEYTKK